MDNNNSLTNLVCKGSVGDVENSEEPSAPGEPTIKKEEVTETNDDKVKQPEVSENDEKEVAAQVTITEGTK